MRASRELLAALAAAQVAYGQLPGGAAGRDARARRADARASAAEAVEARGARAGRCRSRPRRDRLRRGARRRGHRPPVRALRLLRQARAAGRRRAAARGGGVGDDGAAGVGRGGLGRAAAGAARVRAAAGALTAWDVFLDPRMVREGYWSWPGGGRYEGVPASNFLGWWVTGLGVFGVWSVLDGVAAGPRDDGALALYAWTWAGETFANAVLWRGRRGVGRGRRRRRRLGGAVRARRAGTAAARPVRVAVIGAGVGGLAPAVRLAAAGHARDGARGRRRAGRQVRARGARRLPWDSGPSLLTMPWVFEALFAGDRRAARRRARAAPRRARHPLPLRRRQRLRPVRRRGPVARGAGRLAAGRGRRVGRASSRRARRCGGRRSPCWPGRRRGRRGRATGGPVAARPRPRQAVVDAAAGSPARTPATRGCGW